MVFAAVLLAGAFALEAVVVLLVVVFVDFALVGLFLVVLVFLLVPDFVRVAIVRPLFSRSPLAATCAATPDVPRMRRLQLPYRAQSRGRSPSNWGFH